MRSADAEVIRTLPLFRTMDDGHFESLIQPAFLQRFPPHVLLFERGHSPDFLHVLLEGSVEMFARHDDRETTVSIMRPVSTFLLPAVVCRQPSLTSGRTIESSRILMIPTDVVQNVMGLDVAFAQALAAEIAAACRTVVRELKSQKLRTSVERLANWILRENISTGEQNEFEIPFDKRTLASRLGMTPENLSRNFATLNNHGVEVQGRLIRLKDREALTRLARPDPLIDSFEADIA